MSRANPRRRRILPAAPLFAAKLPTSPQRCTLEAPTYAMLSRRSVPPTCISVVTSGVWQRRVGRPAGFADAVGLPGSFRSTKRFINATRAGGVMRENASLLRAVRKRTNSVWFWEQAAESTAFSAALGPSVAVVSLAVLPPGLELESCERAFAVASRMAPLRKKIRPHIFDFRDFTSILCPAQNRRQILRETRARQNFIASRRLRLSSKLCLHVREEADYANVLARLPQLFNGRDRLAPSV